MDLKHLDIGDDDHLDIRIDQFFGNSVIALTIRSFGPCGFGYRITTDAETVVDSVYAMDDSASGREITLTCQPYQNSPRTLRVDDFQKLGLSTRAQKAWHWSCNIVTWDLV